MKELIAELELLIISPPKGASGYTSLRSEESITAYKIKVIINKLKEEKEISAGD